MLAPLKMAAIGAAETCRASCDSGPECLCSLTLILVLTTKTHFLCPSSYKITERLEQWFIVDFVEYKFLYEVWVGQFRIEWSDRLYNNLRYGVSVYIHSSFNLAVFGLSFTIRSAKRLLWFSITGHPVNESGPKNKTVHRSKAGESETKRKTKDDTSVTH